jgi:hypothetical protein
MKYANHKGHKMKKFKNFRNKMMLLRIYPYLKNFTWIFNIYISLNK